MNGIRSFMLAALLAVMFSSCDGGSEFVAGSTRHKLAAKGSFYRSLVWAALPT